MADLALDWGDDLVIGPDGDLTLLDGDAMVQQRIQRRLFTAAQNYVWHPEYGASLPERIGRVALARNIQALVVSQIGLESSVAKVPVPVVTVQVDTVVLGLFNITIVYTDSATGDPVTVNLEVTKG